MNWNKQAIGEAAARKGILSYDAEWPAVDVIIGNPPFLGGSKMRGELGDEYTDTLRPQYHNQQGGEND